MAKNNIWVLYSTFSSREEALSAARALVEKRLIACANIIDSVQSIYRWQGKVMQEQEVVFVAKTSEACKRMAMAEIERLHTYDVPCIVAYPVADGIPEFLQWVEDETAG